MCYSRGLSEKVAGKHFKGRKTYAEFAVGFCTQKSHFLLINGDFHA